MNKPKILVIVGPTASGKTSLAIELAKRFNGEIISADSRQVYKGLDIGSAKVTKEEMDRVPHHLLDVVNPKHVYTASDFKRDASAAIKDILSRRKLPIICGGTFFYIDVLLGKASLPEVGPNETLRAQLEEKTAVELLEMLRALDPQRAQTVEPQNKRRLIRSIEITKTLGSVPTPSVAESPYDTLTIGIQTGKEELRKKFALRAQEWLKNGFLAEIQSLLANGITQKRLSEIGFEYKLGLNYLEGEIDEALFYKQFVEKNWQYAKRQLTWLKRDKTIVWIETGNMEIFKKTEEFLK